MFYIVSMELISKSIHHPINKKLRLNSKLLQSGYEPHGSSSILYWLKDEWASIYSTNVGLLFFA